MKNIIKQRGLSLLELMLVIGIMATMILGAFMLIVRYEQSLKAQAFAVQVRKINNAAVRYFNQWNFWPEKLGVLLKNHYLAIQPGASNQSTDYYNPWRYPYYVPLSQRRARDNKGAPNSFTKYQTFRSQTYFSYYTHIPHVETQRVAALLPFVQISVGSKGVDKITLTTPMPGQAVNRNPSRIQYMATVTVKQSHHTNIPMPTCVNSSYVPQIVYAVTSFCSYAKDSSDQGCLNGRMLHNVQLSCSVRRSQQRSGGGYYELRLVPSYVSSLFFKSMDITPRAMSGSPYSSLSNAISSNTANIPTNQPTTSNIVSYTSLDYQDNPYQPTGTGSQNVNTFLHINRARSGSYGGLDDDWCRVNKYCTTYGPAFLFSNPNGNAAAGDDPRNVILSNVMMQFDTAFSWIGTADDAQSAGLGTDHQPQLTSNKNAGQAIGQIFVATRCVPKKYYRYDSGSCQLVQQASPVPPWHRLTRQDKRAKRLDKERIAQSMTKF